MKYSNIFLNIMLFLIAGVCAIEGFSLLLQLKEAALKQSTEMVSWCGLPSYIRVEQGNENNGTFLSTSYSHRTDTLGNIWFFLLLITIIWWNKHLPHLLHVIIVLTEFIFHFNHGQGFTWTTKYSMSHLMYILYMNSIKTKSVCDFTWARSWQTCRYFVRMCRN